MKTPSFSDFNSRSVKIAILGDLMCERGAVNSVVNGDPFKFITPFLRSHDYVVGQLETTLSGFTSNFPKFSSGDYYAEYLSRHIDFVFTANNHSFDWGVEGVYNTIETLKRYEIAQIGIHKKNKKPHYKGVTVRDFSLSFLNYTQFINHGSKKNTQHQNDVFQESADTADAKGIISFYEESSAKKEINLAKKGCDVVLTAIHLASQKRNGTAQELSRKSTPEQRRFLEQLCASGSDIVLGAHPHYFQGGRQQGRQLIVWSLGNFFTLMERLEYENNSGCVLSVRYDSYLNPTYTFLPVATVYSTQDHFYYVIPIAPLAQGYYPFVSEQKRYALLQELSQIRETLRESSLVEEIIPISLI